MSDIGLAYQIGSRLEAISKELSFYTIQEKFNKTFISSGAVETTVRGSCRFLQQTNYLIEKSSSEIRTEIEDNVFIHLDGIQHAYERLKKNYPKISKVAMVETLDKIRNLF